MGEFYLPESVRCGGRIRIQIYLAPKFVCFSWHLAALGKGPGSRETLPFTASQPRGAAEGEGGRRDPLIGAHS